MTRPLTPRVFLSLALIVLGTGGASRLEAQQTASLTGWAGSASLVSNPGPGEALYLLRASARWPGSESRQRDRYAIRVTLPDGRVERRPLLPSEGPGSPTLTVQIPARSVRNLLPDRVRVEAALVDATTGSVLGNPLTATIAQFPTTASPTSRQPTGPFHRGQALDPGLDEAQTLPNPGPDGLRFVRIFATPERPGLFLSTAEASNQQVAARLPDHDPNANRSDEFLLDAPNQPAVNLTPRQTLAYLEALSKADPSGLTYRLPTRSEWQAAALAGQPSAFWWGDNSGFPGGANFFGPEPGAQTDTTVPADQPSGPGFVANPWGLVHTFGNVAEWVSIVEDDPTALSFARMGGHFRTEPEDALDPPLVDDPDDLGPDPYVGVRPAFDLDAEAGALLIRSLLDDDPAWSGLSVDFDPDRATATLSGPIADSGARRRAVDRLGSLWWLARVEDEMELPTLAPGRLARIGAPTGPGRPAAVLGRSLIQVPVAVRWDGPQPVTGSDWWVNVFGPRGEHFAHQVDRSEPGSPTIRVTVPRSMIDRNQTTRIALSLGRPVTAPDGPGLVSEVVSLRVAP